jgi:glycogen synthase
MLTLKEEKTMRIAILTKEYPPYIYGGAGVHVDYLTKEMSRLGIDIEVLCFGDQDVSIPQLNIKGIQTDWPLDVVNEQHHKVLNPLANNLYMAGQLANIDLVHCHTWYTHLAGCLVQELLQIPLVLTTHSLEPHRPWKMDQLGTGYHLTTWLEQTAYQKADGIIAVSEAMCQDVCNLYQVPPQKIGVIHNGIDPEVYQPRYDQELLRRYGIDPFKPYILFVGRITAQKGLVHLLRTIPLLAPEIQVLLCAASPDTPELGQEMHTYIHRLQTLRKSPVVWIDTPVPQTDIISFYSQAEVFVCPSVYEPFGIINLEAMACQTPVVASKIGGIPEIVEHGQTGFLIPFEQKSSHNPEPKDPEGFAERMAQAINGICQNTELQDKMGRKARQVVKDSFSWSSIAQKTIDFYKKVINSR